MLPKLRAMPNGYARPPHATCCGREGKAAQCGFERLHVAPRNRSLDPTAPRRIRLGIQPGQLPSQAGATTECQALVVNDVEKKAGQDWRKGRCPRTVRHVSDDRCGYYARTVQEHPLPDLTARAAGTSADMTKTAVAAESTWEIWIKIIACAMCQL